jgi:hypothetical protein
MPSVIALIASIMDKTLRFILCAVCGRHSSTGQDKAERRHAEANRRSSNQRGTIAAISLVIR